jgi:hypothetical protein
MQDSIDALKIASLIIAKPQQITDGNNVSEGLESVGEIPVV